VRLQKVIAAWLLRLIGVFSDASTRHLFMKSCRTWALHDYNGLNLSDDFVKTMKANLCQLQQGTYAMSLWHSVKTFYIPDWLCPYI
jgi:hypothetical protein